MEELDINIVKEAFETIKKHKNIVGNIDTNFYLNSTELLLNRIEELENKE